MLTFLILLHGRGLECHSLIIIGAILHFKSLSWTWHLLSRERATGDEDCGGNDTPYHKLLLQNDKAREHYSTQYHYLNY